MAEKHKKTQHDYNNHTGLNPLNCQYLVLDFGTISTVPGSSLETGVRTSYAGYAGAALVSGAAIVAILPKKRKH